MGLGGVLAQAVDNGEAVDIAINHLVGQILGFFALVGFALWLWQRDRRRRHLRPPPSGWYPDPWGQPLERWWNGDTWTPNVRPAPWAVPPGYGMPPATGAPMAPPGPAAGGPPGWQPPLAGPANSSDPTRWNPADAALPPPSADDRGEGGPPLPG